MLKGCSFVRLRPLDFVGLFVCTCGAIGFCRIIRLYVWDHWILQDCSFVRLGPLDFVGLFVCTCGAIGFCRIIRLYAWDHWIL